MSTISSTPTEKQGSLLQRLCRRALFAGFERIEYGRITITENGETFQFGKLQRASDADVRISVWQPSGYPALLFRGTIGAGETYANGDWDADDLTGLIQIFAANQEAMSAMDGAATRVAQAIARWTHWLNRNTRSGSRRNISAHYDLGNDFYEQFLDPTMNYSSGYFMDDETTLEEASLEKLDRICRKLALKPSDHVLEIGCGWGGFAVYAVQTTGCRVTATTISQEQYDYTRARVEAAGLSDRVSVIKQDYRDLEGQYDKIVSVEMIEAVGHRFHKTFFKKCNELLKPEGALCLQSITMRDQFHDRAVRSVDFIKAHIFPGGSLPCSARLTDVAKRYSDLQIVHVEDFSDHYARTLREWRKTFLLNQSTIDQLGYDLRFRRLWEYYLCYCEGGFLERTIGVSQWVMHKPLCRHIVAV